MRTQKKSVMGRGVRLGFSLPAWVRARTVAETPLASRLHLVKASHRHPTWTIALHWSTVVALILAVALILVRDAVDDKNLRILLMDAHRQAGVFVLLALILRLAVRTSLGMADFAGDVPPLIRWAAKLGHTALYALLFALPVLGWASSNAHGVSVTLFGLFALPTLVGDDPDLADTLSDFHLWTAWLLLAIVVAHVSAACWHHIVRRDGVLAAMLPLLRRK